MKRIIAAALSILVGAFGYTIVDSAIEDRVATLESEVVELREEVSRYHPNYSSQTTTRRATTSNFTTIKNDTSTIVTTEKPTTTWVDLSAPIQIGSYLKEDSRSMHKFVLRKWDNGRIEYVSPNSYGNEPTGHIFTMTQPGDQTITLTTSVLRSKDYFLYIIENSAKVTDVSDDISYSHWYDKDYSKVTTEISRPKTTVKILCKGYTDPIFAGKELLINGWLGGYGDFTLKVIIGLDGKFDCDEKLYCNGYISAYRNYSFESISVRNISSSSTTQKYLTTTKRKTTTIKQTTTQSPTTTRVEASNNAVIVTRPSGITIIDGSSTIQQPTTTQIHY